MWPIAGKYVIIALAGRRIDLPESSIPAFPADNVSLVRTRLPAFYVGAPASALVASAACGADLIALDEAGELGLRRRVILPYAADHFRETSVVDRPGNWGPIFDRVVNEVRDSGDLVVLGTDERQSAFELVNQAILDQALTLSSELHTAVAAVVVWEHAQERTRTGSDFTRAFAEEARRRQLRLVEIDSLR